MWKRVAKTTILHSGHSELQHTENLHFFQKIFNSVPVNHSYKLWGKSDFWNGVHLMLNNYRHNILANNHLFKLDLLCTWLWFCMKKRICAEQLFLLKTTANHQITWILTSGFQVTTRQLTKQADILAFLPMWQLLSFKYSLIGNPHVPSVWSVIPKV